jgi:hypothetical protein
LSATAEKEGTTCSEANTCCTRSLTHFLDGWEADGRQFNVPRSTMRKHRVNSARKSAPAPSFRFNGVIRAELEGNSVLGSQTNLRHPRS